MSNYAYFSQVHLVLKVRPILLTDCIIFNLYVASMQKGCGFNSLLPLLVCMFMCQPGFSPGTPSSFHKPNMHIRFTGNCKKSLKWLCAWLCWPCNELATCLDWRTLKKKGVRWIKLPIYFFYVQWKLKLFLNLHKDWDHKGWKCLGSGLDHCEVHLTVMDALDGQFGQLFPWALMSPSKKRR